MPDFISPLSVFADNKKMTLNLNNVINMDRREYSKMKKKYWKEIQPQIENYHFDKISMSYTLHRPFNHECDKMNILSIHDKLFCDALVEYGIIEDDNDSFISDTTFEPTIYDPGNGHVVIHINELSL